MVIEKDKKGLVSTLLVTSGSVVGQLAMLIAMPIITRIYSPEEMGFYAIFIAIVGVFAVIVALHYELVIPLLKSDVHAQLMTTVALVSLMFTVTMITILYFILETTILELLKATNLEGLLVWITISLITSGLVAIFTAHRIRQQYFKAIALSKALRGVVQAVTQVGCGLLGFGIHGLILGAVGSTLLAGFVLFDKSIFYQAGKNWNIHRSKYVVLIKKYKKFPMYSVPSSMINALGAHLPIFILAIFFSPIIVGLYALGFRVIRMPLRFIGLSFSQVFFGLAVQAKQDGNLEVLTLRVWRALFIFSLYSFIPLGFIAPQMFSLVFGSEWHEAGVYAQYLMPWIMASFICISLGNLISVLEKQKEELYFQIGYLLVITISLLIGGFFENPSLALILVGCTGGFVFLGKMFWLLYLTGNRIYQALRATVLDIICSLSLVAFLFLAQFLGLNEWILFVSTILIVIIVHSYNYFVRRVYAF